MPIARRFGGTSRYALSVGLRSIPRFAFGARANAIVTNLGRDAIEMHADRTTTPGGARGEELWRGPCTLVAGATIPYFGLGLKMFAFAGEREDVFQLRCGEPKIMEIMRNLPKVFRGDYFSDRVQDFLCDRVAIELDREVAIEAGGELLGRRSRVELALGTPVTVLSLASR
jgi:hypothetical protein